MVLVGKTMSEDFQRSLLRLKNNNVKVLQLGYRWLKKREDFYLIYSYLLRCEQLLFVGSSDMKGVGCVWLRHLGVWTHSTIWWLGMWMESARLLVSMCSPACGLVMVFSFCFPLSLPFARCSALFSIDPTSSYSTLSSLSHVQLHSALLLFLSQFQPASSFVSSLLPHSLSSGPVGNVPIPVLRSPWPTL